MKAAPCDHQALVDSHFAGTIDSEDERAMRLHLDGCETCRARYRRRLLLANLDPEALSAPGRLGRGLGIREPPPRSRFVWPGAGVAVALAASLFLVLRSPPAHDGFTARGANIDAGNAGLALRLPLHVYRVTDSGLPAPVSEVVHRDDELAFAYENAGRTKYLMIFAVNDLGRVYWFYPGWTDPAANPPAVAASAEPGLHDLPEAVRQHFEGANLDVHALFLDQPMTVHDVEAALGAGAVADSGAADHLEHLRIVP